MSNELLESLKIKFDIEYEMWNPPQEVIAEAVELAGKKYATDKWNISHEY